MKLVKCTIKKLQSWLNTQEKIQNVVETEQALNYYIYFLSSAGRSLGEYKFLLYAFAKMSILKDNFGAAVLRVFPETIHHQGNQNTDENNYFHFTGYRFFFALSFMYTIQPARVPLRRAPKSSPMVYVALFSAYV